MNTLWDPRVNNLDAYGRWAFAEFRDVYAMEGAFDFLVRELATPVGSVIYILSLLRGRAAHDQGR